MADKFYITTPLYYVNASPHIGHSYTNIAADCLARHMRKVIGDGCVWFLTGTDEHGQKIQKAAEEAGLEPKEFSDRMVLKFKALWRDLNISHDDFIRTTEGRHTAVVQRALDILYQKKAIYQDKYVGWYCTPCETFWTQTQVINQDCPDCRRPLERIAETNYFFRLSSYQEWLIGHINSHPDFIRPLNRLEEVLSFLKLNKLTDLCISRPKERLRWGISLPFSPQHVVYVWFDALVNYISAVGGFDNSGKYVSRWWPADLHIIGKDILRQHAIYWPIILRALDIEPPRTIFAHGWWLIGENKMSKSQGNVVSPQDMAERFGIDAYRYFLLRDVPFGIDGNFSEEAIAKRLNSDLANDLGNLVYRTLVMVEKYFAGAVPKSVIPDCDCSKEVRLRLRAIGSSVRASLKEPDVNFIPALEDIWGLVNAANKYIEDTKPWNLSKENRISELKSFIRLLVEVIRAVADELFAFMPHTAESILEQLGRDTIKKGKPLFPRIESI